MTSPQEPLLDEVDQAVAAIDARYRMALHSYVRAKSTTQICAENLYAALRRRQRIRIAGQVSAPVPCRDCLTEVLVLAGAGGYTAGYVHHEIIYEDDAAPYATCGGARLPGI